MQNPNSVPAVSASAEDEIDLQALIGTLLEGRWWIAVATVAALMVGGLYAFSATRIYQSDALVQVETKNSGASAALGDLAEALGQEASPITGEIEILKSRMVIGQAIDQLNLTQHVQPNYFPVLGRALAKRYESEPNQPVAPAVLGLRRFAWGGESLVVSRLDVPDAWMGSVLTLTAASSGTYSLHDEEGEPILKGMVGQPANANLPEGPLTLFVQTLQAAPGTQFTLSRSAREKEISDILANLSVSEKGKQSGILQLTYKGANRKKVAETLNAIVSVYQRQNVERKSAEAQSTLAFLEQQLPELRKKLDESESALNAFRLKVGSVDLTQETQIVLQESVQLEQARLELEQKKREALQRFTPNHPVIQTLDAQLAKLNQRMGGVNSRTRNLPETQQELLTLMQNVKVNTDLYANLLNNAQELRVVKAGTVGNVRIVDYAYPTRVPVAPKVPLIMALSLMLGAMLGVVGVFIRNALHNGVRDPAVVEKATGLPTYASVPFAAAQANMLKDLESNRIAQAILAVEEPQSVTIESLRSLRSALHFAMADASNNIVMLTGPSPGLGKSFISLNLAATLALSGQRVVVVDADMRRGHIHKFVGKARSPGLSELITGAASLDQALQSTSAENLFCITTGTIPPNPSELLLKTQFSDLLKHLSSVFDLVIVDTPPVLAVADAGVVGSQAGTTLLVLKTGEHPLRMIEDTVRRLRSAGVQVRGTIFNQTQQSQGYNGARYGYKYGYYHYEYKQNSVKK